MKKYRIVADVNMPRANGTKFYKCTLDDILDVFSEEDQNIWIWKCFDERGLDALDLDNNLYGSKIIDDTLYICVSDQKPIKLFGKEIPPIHLLDEYSPNVLNKYITTATEKLIKRYITPYELKRPKHNLWRRELIKSGFDESDIDADYDEFIEKNQKDNS